MLTKLILPVVALLALTLPLCFPTVTALAQEVPSGAPSPHVVPLVRDVDTGNGGLKVSNLKCRVAIGNAMYAHAPVAAPDAKCAALMSQALEMQRGAPRIPTAPAHPVMTPGPPPR